MLFWNVWKVSLGVSSRCLLGVSERYLLGSVQKVSLEVCLEGVFWRRPVGVFWGCLEGIFWVCPGGVFLEVSGRVRHLPTVREMVSKMVVKSAVNFIPNCEPSKQGWICHQGLLDY